MKVTEAAKTSEIVVNLACANASNISMCEGRRHSGLFEHNIYTYIQEAIADVAS